VLRHDRVVVSKDAAARLIRTLDPEQAAAAAPHVETIAPAPAPKKEAAPKAAAKPAAKNRQRPKSPRPRRGRISHGSPHYQIIRRRIITEGTRCERNRTHRGV
jgi:hypothetical protein